VYNLSHTKGEKSPDMPLEVKAAEKKEA